MFRYILFFLVFSLSGLCLADQTEIKNYNEAKDLFWELEYNKHSKTIYCNKQFSHRGGLNIEHIFAASWMKATSGCEDLNRKQCRSKSKKFNHMEGDLHNLFPESTKINSLRGDLPFAILNGHANNSCELEIETHAVEPAESARGPIARALLYMSLEYNVDLDDAAESHGLFDLVQSWHCKYPG